MPPIVAHFLTWTTYGTWLSGDARSWVKKRGFGDLPSVEAPNPALEQIMRRRMHEPAFLLCEAGRRVVDDVIREHCQFRGWDLHALNVRSNHVHVLVSADIDGDAAMSQFKQWGTRRLKEAGLVDPTRTKVWTSGGSTRQVEDREGLERVSRYILYEQDRPRGAEV